jgi:flagellar biosynthesis/type III secretory pathway protein FliH
MGLKLEVFESEEKQFGKSETVVMDTLALEEVKLASYDTGYQAGWDDAASAQADDQTRIRDDLARSLQTLSFTYHEARQHILHALEPLMTSIVERVLPLTARATLAPMILDTLRPMALNASDPPITVVLNPAVRPAVEALLDANSGLPVVLQDEDTLSEGTAYIRFQTGETQIDLDEAVSRIARAVHDFFALNGKEPDDGQPQ